MQIWARTGANRFGWVSILITFVERDTGPRHHFEVPLRRGLAFMRAASVSDWHGLRGPVMSADPGKVEVLDVQASGSCHSWCSSCKS